MEDLERVLLTMQTVSNTVYAIVCIK